MFRTWLQRILLGLAGFAVLAGATVAWLVAHFDGDAWKTLAVDWMREERQRTLTIDGPVRLSLFPRLQVVVGKVRLSERFRPGDEFLVLDEASLGVDLVPLLASQLVIRRIDARGARLGIERGVDGLSNVDDLMGLSGPGAIKFDVRRTVIEDARLSVRDARWPLDGEVRIERLQLGRFGPQATPVLLQGRLAMQHPALSGDVDGSFTLAPGADDAPTRLDAMQLGFRGTAVGLQELEAMLHGTARIDSANDRLETQGTRIELQARGENWALEPSTLRLQHFGLQAVGGAVAWTGLEFDGQGRIGNDRRFTARLESPQFGMNGDGVAGRGVKGRFAIEGDAPLQIRIESGAPAGKPQQMRLPGVRAELKAGSGMRRIEGTVSGDALLKLAAGSGAFERLSFDRLDLKGIYEPGTGGAPWPLGARGSFGLLPDGAQWNLNASLAEDACAAEGSAQMASAERAQPQLSLKLKCERLDLGRFRDAWLEDARPGERQPAASARASGATDGPPHDATSVGAPALDLKSMRALEARISLRANQLRLHPVVARDAKLDASLAAGVLKLASLQAKAWDGTIDLSGQADAAEPAREPRVDLRLTASSIDVGGLLDDMADLRGLKGKGRLTAQLQATGRDLRAWRRTLQGQAGVQLRDGAIIGGDLPATLRHGPASAEEAAHDDVERARPELRTAFSDFRATFDIDGGVAHARELEMRSPSLQVAASGRVDLGTERVELAGDARVNAPAKARDPDEYGPLRGVSVPVELSGPFDAVDWRVRWSALLDSESGAPLRDRWAASAARAAEASAAAEAASVASAPEASTAAASAAAASAPTSPLAPTAPAAPIGASAPPHEPTAASATSSGAPPTEAAGAAAEAAASSIAEGVGAGAIR